MDTTHTRQKIAVIGGGVAGITAAYLLDRKHDVTLFEKNHYVGGHTNTIVIPDGPDQGMPVDTGFIVMNDRTYPHFTTFLDQLGVATRDSDMSFSFYSEKKGLQYAGTSLNALFTQRFNLIRPSFIRMVGDIFGFNARATSEYQQGLIGTQTLGEYLSKLHMSKEFINHYLLPMGAAIWSTPAKDMLDYPALTFVRFFHNHGLLSLRDRPTWKTVVGGSHSYVKAFLQRFSGQVRTESRIDHVRRDQAGVMIRAHDGAEEHFDCVVLAAHADQSYRLLADPTPLETKLLHPWKYSNNHTVLHTDVSVLPPHKRAWASWNYTVERDVDPAHPVSLTYYMNRLQGLTSEQQYCVTLNRTKPIPREKIIREIEYTHPIFSLETISLQEQLPLLNDQGQMYYCGSYFGYGFHEDAVNSGLAVARKFGIEL